MWYPGKNIAEAAVAKAGEIGRVIGNSAVAGTLQAQKYNTSEREAAQAYQTEMSNSAVQRQMADLKAAGLNPYAMFASGQSVGASVPSSEGASSSAANVLAGAKAGADIVFKTFNLGRGLFKDAFNSAGSLAKIVG